MQQYADPIVQAYAKAGRATGQFISQCLLLVTTQLFADDGIIARELNALAGEAQTDQEHRHIQAKLADGRPATTIRTSSAEICCSHCTF